jgi:hypothetical protein
LAFVCLVLAVCLPLTQISDAGNVIYGSPVVAPYKFNTQAQSVGQHFQNWNIAQLAALELTGWV